MVLTFALCATLAFAQTATPRAKEYKAIAKSATMTKDYGRSIFTKDAAPIVTVDFSAENNGYSTGVITGGLEGHAENYDYATWRRIANADSSTFVSISTIYSALVQNYFGGVETFASNMMRYADTSASSTENGFMMMSLYDQRTPNSGNFNAYILLSNIDVSSTSVFDVQFYQYYRKYYDNCYIDYSTDGNTWHEVEINTTGIDMEVNGALMGMATYTLPLAAAGQSNLSIRIRYKSLNSNRGTYGYFWLIDDVSIVPGDADRLKQYKQEFVEGNYGMIPQGMTINPAWYTQVYNNGSNPQSNVAGKIYHLNATQDQATLIDNYNNGTAPTSSFSSMISDRAGWLLPDSLDYRGWYGYIDHTAHGTGSALPTTTAGDNYFYASLENNTITLNYDTMYYNVTTANSNGEYTWGHDNGVLVYSPYNYWIYGYTYQNGNWYVTEDREEVHYYQPGYMVTSRYTTDQTVPTDWAILGVELVASPVNGFHSTGAKISAVLSADEYDGGSVGFQNINTGANLKEITSADVNDSTIIGRNSNGYRENGQYNTVRIYFPEMPALEPNTSYRVGYSMEEEGYFACAAEATGSYRVASPTRPDTYDTIIYFRSNEATQKYANYFAPNQYQSFITDPSYGGDGNRSMFAYFMEINPMIRLIVGPARQVSRKNIEVSCEGSDFGTAYYGGNEVCGTTITPAEGSTCTIIGQAAAGCVAKVFVDGQEITPWDDDEETGDPHLTIAYDEELDAYAYYYSFANITADHQIQFVFSEKVSIDPVAAGVHMILKPNPASSQVSLNIQGVAGMVNCVLIDMSGRVVYNQNINAENAQVINLSNLAKGAYFVRITNDKFSKVEKLIVR